MTMFMYTIYIHVCNIRVMLAVFSPLQRAVCVCVCTLYLVLHVWGYASRVPLFLREGGRGPRSLWVLGIMVCTKHTLLCVEEKPQAQL